MRAVKRKSGNYVGKCECGMMLATFDVTEGQATCPACGEHKKVRSSGEVRIPVKDTAAEVFKVLRSYDKDTIQRHIENRWYRNEINIAEMYFKTGGTLTAKHKYMRRVGALVEASHNRANRPEPEVQA